MFKLNKGYLEKVWPSRTGLFHVKQGYLWQQSEILGSRNISVSANGNCITNGSIAGNLTSEYNKVSISADGLSVLSPSSPARSLNTTRRTAFVLDKGILDKSWIGNKSLVLKNGYVWEHIETKHPELFFQSLSCLSLVSGYAAPIQFKFTGNKHSCTARGASVTYGDAELYKYINVFAPPGKLFFEKGLLFRHTAGLPLYYQRRIGIDKGLLYPSLLLSKEHRTSIIVLGASGSISTNLSGTITYVGIPKQVATASGHAQTSCAPIDAYIPNWSTASGNILTSIEVSEPQIIGVATANGSCSSCVNVNVNAIYSVAARGHILQGQHEKGQDDPSYPTTWHYVATYGNDNTGDGTIEKPYATVKKAIEAASSGHGIRILPGTYTLSPFYISQYTAAGLYDLGKVLHIEGYNEQTILVFYGSSVNPNISRDANLIAHIQYNTVISNLVLHYYPNRNTNYSNAVAAACSGKIANCIIENKSVALMSMSYWNEEPQDRPRFYNCIIKSNGMYYQNDYTGRPLYVGCLADFPIDRGTKQYCLYRTITSADWDVAKLPFDLYQKGHPDILNPDRSRSHIGVCGGPYAWGYEFVGKAALSAIRVIAAQGNISTAKIKAEITVWHKDIEPIQANGLSRTYSASARYNILYSIKSTTGRARLLSKSAAVYKKYTITASGHSRVFNWWIIRLTSSGHVVTDGTLFGGTLHHCEIAYAVGHSNFNSIAAYLTTVLAFEPKAVSRLIPKASINIFFSATSRTGKITTYKKLADLFKYHPYPITSTTGFIRTYGRARIPPPNEHIIRANARIRTYPYCITDMDYYLHIIGFRIVHWIPTSGTAYYNVYRSDYPGQEYYMIGTAHHQPRPRHRVTIDLKPRNLTAIRTPEGIKLTWDSPEIDGYPITIKPVPVGSDQQEAYSPTADIEWISDSLPSGSSWENQTGLEISNFRRHGSNSFKLTAVDGNIEPRFSGANTPIPGGYIIVWVYIDKDNVPDSFWLSFYDGDWHHCHYWSKNKKVNGRIGSPEKLFIEELPTPGLWTPVIVDTKNIDVSNITGMGFGVNKENGTGIVYVDSVYYTDQYVVKMDFPHIGLDFEKPYIIKKFNTEIARTNQTEFVDTEVINIYGFTNTSGIPAYNFSRDPIENKVIITWGIPISSGTSYQYSVASVDMIGIKSEFITTSITVTDLYDHTDITISSETGTFTVTVVDPIYIHENVISGETYHYKFETKDSNNTTIAVVETDYQVPYGSVLGNFRLGKSVLV